MRSGFWWHRLQSVRISVRALTKNHTGCATLPYDTKSPIANPFFPNRIEELLALGHAQSGHLVEARSAVERVRGRGSAACNVYARRLLNWRAGTDNLSGLLSPNDCARR